MFYFKSHISENIDELKLVKDLFPDSETYTDVYHKFNLLTDKVRHVSSLPSTNVTSTCMTVPVDCAVSQTIMAHGCHLSDKELTVFRETGTSLSHCPNSNFS